MGALQDFIALVEGTEAMKQLLKSLREEAAHMLGRICREYERTNQPVPDHHLYFPSYIGETSIKALISAGLIRVQPGGRISLYQYEPTPEGLEQYRSLSAEGFYESRTAD